jgi:hypothetical protein
VVAVEIIAHVRALAKIGSFVRSAAVEKRELSKYDFEMIDDAFKALLRSSHPDPLMRSKIIDLKDKFRDAFTGWLEIEVAA